MDINIAKRVTAGTVTIFLFVVYFMCQMPSTSNAVDQSCDMNDVDLDFPLKVMIHDLMVFAYVMCIAYFSLAPGLQMSDELIKTLRAGRLADSVLNHILKNSVAGAACLIEIEIEDMPESNDRLSSALEQLHGAMEWCVSRQVMLNLLDASYKSVLSPCIINRFLARMVQASVGKGSITVKENIETDGASDQEVLLDVHMAEIAIANALSNAVAHGDTSEAVEVSSHLLEDTTGQHSVVLKVENFIPKEAEGQLTDDILKNICIDAMKDSAPKRNKPAKQTAKVSTSISTNSGLYHIHLACHGAAGWFDLKLGSRKGRTTVVLRVSLPVRQDVVRCAEIQVAAGQIGSYVAPTSAHLNSSQGSIPEGLKICAIDDSKILCKGYERLVLPKLKADKASSCVVCPVSSSCIDRFMSESIGASSTDDKENRPAGIAILDQHISFTNSAGVETHHVLGTNLAEDMRSRNFKGLVLIRSANSTKEDCAGYLQSGAVDGCLGKDQGSEELVAEICAAFCRKKQDGMTSLGLQQQPTSQAVTVVGTEALAFQKGDGTEAFSGRPLRGRDWEGVDLPVGQQKFQRHIGGSDVSTARAYASGLPSALATGQTP
jgi:hypothetical protein